MRKMMMLGRTLTLLLTVVGLAGPMLAQVGGEVGKKCPDQGTVHVPPHYHCASYKYCGVVLTTPLGSVGYKGDKCHTARFFYPAYDKCGAAGKTPGVRCVAGTPDTIEKEVGECELIGLPSIGLALPTGSCVYTNEGAAGETPDKDEESCE